MQIKSMAGEILYEGADLSLRETVESAASNGADLRGADLRWADLHNADLRGANLDLASWPLHCGSFGARADDRLVSQLICHVARLDISGCSGGVREAIEHLRAMAITDLFCEYRNDVKPLEGRMTKWEIGQM